MKARYILISILFVSLFSACNPEEIVVDPEFKLSFDSGLYALLDDGALFGKDS